MTIYDDMRGYVHTHDRNGWFDVIAETTPMYQMIDKADAENFKLREENDKLRRLVVRMRPICMEGKRCTFADRIYINNTMEELGIEVPHD